MENNSLEVFKLDEIDRKVFFWLITPGRVKALRSWSEYIKEEYWREQIIIDSDALLKEGINLFNELNLRDNDRVNIVILR